MAITREDLVRIVRDTIGTSECDNPITFDPPEWAIRAMQRAYERGVDALNACMAPAAAVMLLRLQLYGAAQRLKGDDLDDLRTLIDEIAVVLDVGRTVATA